MLFKKNSCFCFLFFVFFLLDSCKKENAALDISLEEINSPAKVSLYKIFPWGNDTLFVCGGSENYGVILKSIDKGKSFFVFKEFDKPIYSVGTFNGIDFLAGSSFAKILRSHDGGYNWNEYIDYSGVGQYYQVPLRCLKFLSATTAFFCGGNDFMNGLIYATYDGGQNWIQTEIQHELRSMDFADDKNGITIGYGCLLQTNDTGKSWQLLPDKNEEFFTGVQVKNNTELFVCGYDGGIYKATGISDNFDAVKKSNNSASSVREHYNCISIKNNSLFVSGFNGISCFSKNNGASIQTGKSFDDNTIYSVLLFDESSGIACGTKGKIFRFSF